MVPVEGDEPHGKSLAARGMAYARRLGAVEPGSGDRTLPEILVQRFRLDPALEEWGGFGSAFAARTAALSGTDRTRPA